MGLKWKLAQWAELKWWQSYLKDKEKSEYLHWKSTYWRNLLGKIDQVYPIEKDAWVLDAGCGPAGVFLVLNDPSFKTVAFDPLLGSYESDVPFFKKSDYPNVSFKCCGIEDFKHDEQFDLIFCMNAINHVADIDLSYKNLLKHLKPGGTIVLSIDAHNHSFFKRLFRFLPGDILHPHQYDLEEYGRFLTENACDLIYEEKLKEEFFFDHYVQVAIKRG